jgi:hypothetical protein
MNKVDLLAKMRAEQELLDAFLSGLIEAERAHPNACGVWSTGDVVAHLPVWARYMTSMIRAWLRGRPATPHETWGTDALPNLRDDALNQWFVDQARNQSFDMRHGVLREVHTQLIGTIAVLTDDELTKPGLAIPGLGHTRSGALWEAVLSMSYDHVAGHLRDVRAALGK